MIKSLFKSFNKIKNESKLHYYCRHLNYEKVILLIKSGADINKKDFDGNSLLNIVALYHSEFSLDFLEFLIKNGVDINNKVKEENDRTALMQAVLTNHLELVEFLIKHDANLNLQDSNKETALMYAAWTGNVEIFKLLIEAGSDLNIQNYCGWTALHFANNQRHLEKVKLLILSGADLNKKDKEGKSFKEVGDLSNEIELLIEKRITLENLNLL